MIDVGLHYKDKNRDWALGILSKYALEDSDLARKEIMHCMSIPGQVTADMVGRLEIMKARRKLEEKLGDRFNLKEFHYQVSRFFILTKLQVKYFRYLLINVVKSFFWSEKATKENENINVVKVWKLNKMITYES